MRYRVDLHGHNFLIERNGSLQKMGFFTHRVVEAEDSQSAEAAAIQALREDPTLAARKNQPDDPATVEVEEVYEAPGSQSAHQPPGLAFYSQDQEGDSSSEH